MKNQGLKNPFSQEDKELFRDALYCWICGRNINAGLSAHHILKRTSSSVLGLAPLCNRCHDLGKIHWKDTRVMLLGKTLKWLLSINYKLKDKDIAFLEDNAEYYTEVWEKFSTAQLKTHKNQTGDN